MRGTSFLITYFVLSIATLFAQKSVVKELYFDLAKSTISESDKALLSNLLSTETIQQIESIQVNGHTDSIGTLSYNEGLAQERVDRVCNYLIQEMKILPNLISRNQFGEIKPKYKRSEWGNNRRVELILNFIQKEQEVPDRDTTITKNCLTLEVEAGTFAPHKNSEVKIEVIIIDSSNMADYNITLRDENNLPLISGGMFYLKATVDGKPVEQKKEIEACIPAQNYPKEVAENMDRYEGVKDENGNIVWRKISGDCKTKTIAPVNPENKPCDCYAITFNGNSPFQNCDYRCSDLYTNSTLFIPTLDAKDAFWSADENLAVHFLSGKPKNVEVCYTPKPDMNYKARPNDMVSPPMFQDLNLHRDLVIKCNKEAYDSKKKIRLFISRRFKNDNQDMISPEKLPGKAYENIAVYHGKMNDKGLIEWNETPVFSELNDLAHCYYLVFDLPFTGYYKIVDIRSASKSSRNKLKIRGPKGAEILAAHNKKNYIHYKLDQHEKRKKQFVISKVDEPENTILQITIQRKKVTLKAEILFSKLLYKSNRDIYIFKRKYFYRIKK
jgi:hypothetical protein